jgi:IS605 OrfB family transposase
MNMQITMKLRIRADDEQVRVLKETVQAYTGSFNRVCATGYKKRRVNGVELHHATYRQERENTDLPSQLVCSARMKATEALKSVRALKKKGRKVSVPRSRNCPVRYDARSATVRLTAGTASLATLDGRQHVSFEVPPHHADRIDWDVCSADLCTDRRSRLWIHVVVKKDISKPEPTGEVMGVDLGVRRPAVTSNNQFLGQRHWREVEDRNFRIKRALQAKGTKSAKRHLKKLAGRVNRFRRDCDHVLSKQIVASVEGGATIAMEDLTDIRTRVKARRKQRRRLHAWSFARLKGFVDYKAELVGVHVVAVDPRYTSQKCSRCGKRDRRSRKSQSEFRCTGCGFRLNADLNAARNIAVNHLAGLARRGIGGPPVNWPIVGEDALHRSTYKPPALAGGS